MRLAVRIGWKHHYYWLEQLSRTGSNPFYSSKQQHYSLSPALKKKMVNSSGNNDDQSPRQYVWFVRYGLTQYPLVEFKGPYDSTFRVAL